MNPIVCTWIKYSLQNVGSTSKDPGPEDQALVSPHRGVIDTLLNLVGVLEYWSIGVLGLTDVHFSLRRINAIGL